MSSAGRQRVRVAGYTAQPAPAPLSATIAAPSGWGAPAAAVPQQQRHGFASAGVPPAADAGSTPSPYLLPPPAPHMWMPSKQQTAGRLTAEQAINAELAEMHHQQQQQQRQAAPPHSKAAAGLWDVYSPSSTQALPRDPTPRVARNTLVAQASSSVPSHNTMQKLLGKIGASSSSGGGAGDGGTAVEAFSVGALGLGSSSPSSAPVISALHTAHPKSSGSSGGGAKGIGTWTAELPQLLAAGRREEALMRPGPRGGMVRCYIRRRKPAVALLGGHGVYFELHLEEEDILLAAARHSRDASSSYLIATAADEVARDDAACVAKLKSNVLGTEYLLRTKATSGGGGSGASGSCWTAQVLCANYKPTINQVSGGPRTMSCVLPLPGISTWPPLGSRLTAGPAGITYGSSSGGGGGAGSGSGWGSSAPGMVPPLGVCLERALARELAPALERQLVLLHSQKPLYDEARGVHHLDFKGRVTKSSVKNFQLVAWDHNSNTLGAELALQFGKRGHEEYALDFAYPLNALQAFALALASFDSKLCYAM